MWRRCRLVYVRIVIWLQGRHVCCQVARLLLSIFTIFNLIVFHSKCSRWSEPTIKCCRSTARPTVWFYFCLFCRHLRFVGEQPCSGESCACKVSEWSSWSLCSSSCSNNSVYFIWFLTLFGLNFIFVLYKRRRNVYSITQNYFRWNELSSVIWRSLF